MFSSGLKLSDISFDKAQYKFSKDKLVRLNLQVKAERSQSIRGVYIEYGYFFQSKVSEGSEHEHFEKYNEKVLLKDYNFKSGEVQYLSVNVPLLVPVLECEKVLLKQYVKIIVDIPFKKDIEKVIFLENIDFSDIQNELESINRDLLNRIEDDLLKKKEIYKNLYINGYIDLHQFFPNLFYPGDIARYEIVKQLIDSKQGMKRKFLYIGLIVFYKINKFFKGLSGFTVNFNGLIFIIFFVIYFFGVMVFISIFLNFGDMSKGLRDLIFFVLYFIFMISFIFLFVILLYSVFAKKLFKDIDTEVAKLKLNSLDERSIERFKSGSLHISDLIEEIYLNDKIDIKGKILIRFLGVLQTYHMERRGSGDNNSRVRIKDVCSYIDIPLMYEDINFYNVNQILKRELKIGELVKMIDKLPKVFESKSNKIFYVIRIELIFDDLPDISEDIKITL